MPSDLPVDPAHSFTFLPLAAHVGGGTGDLLLVGTATRFEDVARYHFRLLAYRFDRDTVRARNFAPFLEFFDLERIESAGLLHGLHNRVIFDFGLRDDGG